MSGAVQAMGMRSRVVVSRVGRPDVWLLIAAAGLAGLGVVMVFNASYFYARGLYGDPFVFVRKHVVALVVGVAGAVLVSRVPCQRLERVAYPLFAVALFAVLLLLVPGIGAAHGGARRWVHLGPFNLQPSEFAKLAVVLLLARAITRRQEVMARFWRGVVPLLAVVGVCVLPIAAQPDFGTAVIVLCVTVLMLYAGGARVAHLVSLALAAAPVVVFALVHWPYRWKRILAFLDPWRYSQDIAFQLVQSLIAFGSGGLTGIGLGESRQKMFFLPEAHTDFIFALVGEELGVCGALLVVGLFALAGLRGFRVATRYPDTFGSLLAFGVTLLVLLEAVVNIGVVVGLLPTKGLALPFLSYGGSALIGTFLQIGILAGLSRKTG